jgi:membrane protein YdbS with pleckstrin-like domain
MLGGQDAVDYLRTKKSPLGLVAHLRHMRESMNSYDVSDTNFNTVVSEEIKSGKLDVDLEAKAIEKVLYEEHPAMFRNHPFLFILSIILIAAYGLGFLILLIWWLQTLGTKLTLTNERITLRNGILSKYTNEVFHTDIRNVQLDQSFFQRVFDVGALRVSTSGQEGIEISVQGIPHPKRVRDLIDKYRRQNV